MAWMAGRSPSPCCTLTINSLTMPTETNEPQAGVSKPRVLAGKDRVRIRMYRHGLGDCFLLTFRGKAKDVHVMIDCGIVLGTTEPGDVMKKVAQDVKQATGGTVDVLVITHEHWDHVSGFDA